MSYKRTELSVTKSSKPTDNFLFLEAYTQVLEIGIEV